MKRITQLQETIHREITPLGDEVIGYSVHFQGFIAHYQVGDKVIKLLQKPLTYDELRLPREVGTYDVWNVIDDEPLIWNSQQFFKYARRILEAKTSIPLTDETRTISCDTCGKSNTPDRFACLECDPAFYSYPWSHND